MLRKILIIIFYNGLILKRESNWFIKISSVPLIFSLIAILIYKDNNPDFIIKYVLYGSTVMGMWVSNVFLTGYEIRKELAIGTFDNIIISPTKLHSYVLIKGIFYSVLGLTTFLIISIITFLLFDNVFNTINPIKMLLILIYSIINLSILGTLLSGIFIFLKEFNYFSTIITRVIFILCGLMFPIDLLPDFVRYFSYLLSPTWIVMLLRESSEVRASEEMLVYIVIIGILSIVYYLILKFIFNKIEDKYLKNLLIEG